MYENALTELRNAIVENCVPPLCKAVEQAEEIWERFCKACEAIFDEIAEIVEEIKRQCIVEKPKDWRIPIKQEIRPLYLDKRRKVHRCRNNC